MSVPPTPDCFLGVDPSLNKCGYAVLVGSTFVEVGTIKPNNRQALADRLFELQKGLRALLRAWIPSMCGVELPGAWSTRLVALQRPETLLHLGAAAGIVIATCRNEGNPVITPTVDVIRKQMLGKAQSSKEDAQAFIVAQGFELPLLKSGNVNADAADAMLVSLYVREVCASQQS